MVGMKVPVCKICNDTMSSYICPRCLSEDIRKWLPREISGDFDEFHRFFSGLFGDNEELITLNCLHCKEKRDATVCPFCYVFAVSEWLEEKDRHISRQLARMFSFGHEPMAMNSGSAVFSETACGITDTGPERIFEGRCELCEGYSDGLVSRDGKRVCGDCAEWLRGLKSVKIICVNDRSENLLKKEDVFRRGTGLNEPDARRAITGVGAYERKF
jgi:hypothetical protein